MVCFGCCWSFYYSSTYSYVPSWNFGGGLLSLLLGFFLNSSTYLPSRKFCGVLLWFLLQHLPVIKEVLWCFVVVSVATPTFHQGSACGVLLWLLLQHLPAIKEVLWCFVVVSVAAPACHQGSSVVFCCGFCCSTCLPSRKFCGVLFWFLLQHLPAIKEVLCCFVVVSVAAPTCHQGSSVVFCCGFFAAPTCHQGSAVVFCCGCCCSTFLPSRKCGGVLLWFLLQHLPAIKEVRWCFVVVAVGVLLEQGGFQIGRLRLFTLHLWIP
jgi:hypothetical protein